VLLKVNDRDMALTIYNVAHGDTHFFARWFDLFGTYLFDDTGLKQPEPFNNNILNTHQKADRSAPGESHVRID
jgi:hypothetical protein